MVGYGHGYARLGVGSRTMQAGGNGGHNGIGLLGFRGDIPRRVIHAALILADAVVAEHHDSAELVLALAREYLAEQRLAALPVAPAPPVAAAALSTEQAAALLGVKPYTVNEWARLGRIRAWKDSTRGAWHFEPDDVAAYKAEHMRPKIADGIAGAYSPVHETLRRTRPTAQARANPTPIGVGPPCDPQHGRPLGARRAPRQPASRGRPFAPGSHAWDGRRPETRGPRPEPEG